MLTRLVVPMTASVLRVFVSFMAIILFLGALRSNLWSLVFLQVYLLQNRFVGCFELLVFVLDHSLVVGRLYFRPWVGFVMLRV
jgi:hypothetical protein